MPSLITREMNFYLTLAFDKYLCIETRDLYKIDKTNVNEICGHLLKHYENWHCSDIWPEHHNNKFYKWTACLKCSATTKTLVKRFKIQRSQQQICLTWETKHACCFFGHACHVGNVFSACLSVVNHVGNGVSSVEARVVLPGAMDQLFSDFIINGFQMQICKSLH